MKKRFGYLILFLLIVVLGLFLFLHRGKRYSNDPERTVYVKKEKNSFELIRHGKPFYIKGASGNGYIKELSEAGANTFRVYDTTNLRDVLDEAQLYNIAVIVDIPLPKVRRNLGFYSNEDALALTELRIESFVNRYKDHPALLFWNLGNEIYYGIKLDKGTRSFIRFYNKQIDKIHRLDPNHPISTTVAGPSKSSIFAINQFFPQLDLLGVNSFSNIKSVKVLHERLSYISSTLPYFIGEWGVSGPWEGERNIWSGILELPSTQKGERYKWVYKTYIEPDANCLGSLAFFWGTKVEGTPTWFNVFDEAGRKCQIYYDLKSVWTSQETMEIEPPKVGKLFLDGKQINAVFLPNQTVRANFYLDHNLKDSLYVKWQIQEEVWGKKKWPEQWVDMSKYNLEPSKLNEAKFTTPKKEGPYRIFAYIYDQNGNFSTTNSPFYILKPE